MTLPIMRPQPPRRLRRHSPPVLLVLLLVVAACGGGEDGSGGTTPTGPTDPPPGPTNQAPVAHIAASVTTGSAPLGLELDASGSTDADGNVASYAWSFGDGTSAAEAKVTHVYESPGTYTVQLTVTDDLGATGTATATIQANQPQADEIFGLVWFDRNNDGVRGSGEDGVRGTTVFVDANGNGALDMGERSETTGVGGIYRFSGMEPGTYQLAQRLPVGWTNSSPGPGSSPSPPAGAVPPPQRIIQGDTAPEGEFPFQVSLQIASVSSNNDAHFCGGTLIAPAWVLTAGHCVAAVPPEQTEVLVGTQNMGEGGTRVPVKQGLIHPFYVPGSDSFKRDMALLELEERFPDIPRVFLVDADLFDKLVVPFGLATVIGWGRTVEGVVTSIPDALQVIQIPVLEDKECTLRYGDLFDQTMVCAGFLAGGKSSCQGDSGGPLLFDYLGSWWEAGIVSWGVGCGGPERPGVYARVSAMLDFVLETVPPEPSGSVSVTLAGAAARADFGNFH